MTTPTQAQIGVQKALKLGSWEQKIVNATIERCAEVADGYDGDGESMLARAIAADIRKLKDEPAVDPNIVYPGKDPDFVFPEEGP